MDAPRFRPVADHAILVEFGETITDAAHDAVLKLDRALAAHPFAGFNEAIPAFVNLLVDFDPLITDHDTVETALYRLLALPAAAVAKGQMREVLVCYEGAFGQDLKEVATRTGLSEEAVINAHLSGDYKVFMYGFAPGYAYLAGVPTILQLPRKPSPIRDIEAGAVMIASAQCLVTTLIMPTGWWIIGRSPTRILTDDPVRPFLFDVGDQVRFRRISLTEFDIAGGL